MSMGNCEKKSLSNKDYSVIRLLERIKWYILHHDLETSDVVNNDLKKEMEGLDSALILPIISREILLGFIVLSRKEKRHYTIDNISVFTTLANQSTLAMENISLYGNLEAKERVRSAELKLSLLLLKDTEIKGYETAGCIIPAREVTSDYYHIIPVNDRECKINSNECEHILARFIMMIDIPLLC